MARYWQPPRQNDRASLSQALFQAGCQRLFPQPPLLCRLDSGGYSDTAAPWISLGGSASLDAFCQPNGHANSRQPLSFKPYHPHRHPAYWNKVWAGQTLTIGEVELEVIEPVGRCGAISVNPHTGIRERDYLPEMEQACGHTDLGMFARIRKKSGSLQKGTAVSIKK